MATVNISELRKKLDEEHGSPEEAAKANPYVGEWAFEWIKLPSDKAPGNFTGEEILERLCAKYCKDK